MEEETVKETGDSAHITLNKEEEEEKERIEKNKRSNFVLNISKETRIINEKRTTDSYVYIIYLMSTKRLSTIISHNEF